MLSPEKGVPQVRPFIKRLLSRPQEMGLSVSVLKGPPTFRLKAEFPVTPGIFVLVPFDKAHFPTVLLSVLICQINSP